MPTPDRPLTGAEGVDLYRRLLRSRTDTPCVDLEHRTGGVVRPIRPEGMPTTGTTQGSGQAKAVDHPRSPGRDLARLAGRAFLAGVGAQLGRELARRITR